MYRVYLDQKLFFTDITECFLLKHYVNKWIIMKIEYKELVNQVF